VSAVLDVGDATELTFTSIAGALVTYDWLDPDLVPVVNQQVVPPRAGKPQEYPVTLVPTRAGMWTARFFNAGSSEDYFVRATSTVGKPPPFAAIGDVSIQFGDLDEDQENLTAYLIKAASSLVRQRFKLIDTQIAAGLLDPDVVALTVSGMVLRVLRNPEGLRSETTGPFSRTYDTSAAAGLLVITPDDAGQLIPPDSTAAGATKFPVAGTIRVQPGLLPDSPRTSWPFGGGGYGSW
jgi:hypothetical protein